MVLGNPYARAAAPNSLSEPAPFDETHSPLMRQVRVKQEGCALVDPSPPQRRP